jgi:arylsulfatase A-like enzyme
MARPNVVLIMADQLRYDRVCRQPENAALYRTPAMDALLRQGTAYDRAYTASPLCSPSRASIFTGKRPSHHGLTALGLGLDPAIWTVTRALRDAGYYCHLAGKSHLQPYAIEGSGWVGLAERDDAELAQRQAFEMAEVHVDRPRPLPDDYYGFHSVDLAIGHGDEVGGHFPHWVARRAAGSARPPEPVVEPTEPAAASRYDEQTHPSAFVAERARAVIERCARSRTPFFLVASFPDPHHPYRAPRRHYEATRDLPVRLPESFADPGTVPRHLMPLLTKQGDGASGYETWSVTAAQLTEYIRAEAACVNFLDECIGRILDSLRATGVDDDTVIILASDHGDMFGDHQLMYKHGTHYDGVTHVPLVVRSPDAVGGNRVPDVVSTLDIAATVCALTGVAVPGDLDGTELPTAATSGTGRFVLVEEDVERTHSTLPAGTRIRTVLSDVGRLTLYSEGAGEFYLRADDPHENMNRFDDPTVAGALADHLKYLAWTLLGDLPRTRIPRYSG